MDVAILAGGFGTRLKGLWDHPKCLVPYKGAPIIEHLIRKVTDEFVVGFVYLLLGHKAAEVIAWQDSFRQEYVFSFVESFPIGTAVSLHRIAPLVADEFLVLNGDTIPLYSFRDLYKAFKLIPNNRPGARDIVAAWSSQFNCYAGAAIFNMDICRNVFSGQLNLEHILHHHPRVYRHHIPSFLDVGTPEGFDQAIVEKKE